MPLRIAWSTPSGEVPTISVILYVASDMAGIVGVRLPSTVMAEPSADERVEEQAEHRDALPEDLDASGFVGPYTFPDIRRRRIPGYLYLASAAACGALWAVKHGDGAVLVNDGF